MDGALGRTIIDVGRDDVDVDRVAFGAYRTKTTTVVVSYRTSDIDENDGDEIDSWNIGGTWYLNQRTGIGLDFSRFDNLGIEEDIYDISAVWFVTEGIGLSLSDTQSETDDTDVESDAIVLGAELRF